MTAAGMPGDGSVFSADASDPNTAHDSESRALTRAEKARQARAANAPDRKAKTAERRAAIATRNGPTGFRIGQQVHTNTPRSPRFHNRTGVVVTNNLGEVGVAFPGDKAEKEPDAVDAWFRPSELTRIRTTGLVSDLRGVRGL